MLKFPLFFYLTCAKYYTAEERMAMREDALRIIALTSEEEFAKTDHPIHHQKDVVDRMIVVVLKEQDSEDWTRYKLINNKNDKYVLGEMAHELAENAQAWERELRNCLLVMCHTNGLEMVGTFLDPTLLALPLDYRKESE